MTIIYLGQVLLEMKFENPWNSIGLSCYSFYLRNIRIAPIYNFSSLRVRRFVLPYFKAIHSSICCGLYEQGLHFVMGLVEH